jgi:hypothetical protein
LLDRDEKVVNVMTFTDGDLKRLKEENECGFCSPRVTGLINRLEAAEAYLHHKDSFEYAEAWRKAAGRE